MLEQKKGSINIKNLIVPEPQPDNPTFDPERDITPEEWDNYINHLMGDEVEVENFIEEAGILHYLSASQYGKIAQTVEEKRHVCEGRLAELKADYIGQPDHLPGDYLRYFLFWNRLYPDNTLDLASEEVYQKTKTMLAQESDFDDFFYAHLLFPAQREDIPQDAGVKSLLEEALKEEREIMAIDSTAGEQFNELASTAKVMFPSVLKDNPIGQDTWASMKEQLHVLAESEEWESFAYTAFNMLILAADKIIYQKEGPEFVMPKQKPDIKEGQPPLPNVKQF